MNQTINKQATTLNNTGVFILPQDNWNVSFQNWKIEMEGDTTTAGSDSPRTLEINSLVQYKLRVPLTVFIQKDGDGWLVESNNFPIYGYSNSYNSAIDSFKRELEDLYDELTAGSYFSDYWIVLKNELDSLIYS